MAILVLLYTTAAAADDGNAATKVSGRIFLVGIVAISAVVFAVWRMCIAPDGPRVCKSCGGDEDAVPGVVFVTEAEAADIELALVRAAAQSPGPGRA